MTIARTLTIRVATVLENDVITIEVELKAKEISFDDEIA